MKLLLSFLIILTCLRAEQCLAQGSYASNHAWRQEDVRPGYSADIKSENEETGEILYFVENPYRNDLKLQDQIYDKTISKEITQRYREQFGRTEAEIIYERTPYLTNNFTETDANVFNQDEYRKRQRKFGDFIAKRLVEYHFETKAKDDPTLKSVYETKQKVEKVDVSFAKDWKLRLKYRISSNSINSEIKNPYIDISARTELSGKETVFTAQKQFLKTYQFLTDYYLVTPRWDIVLRKKFEKFDLSLTYTPFREMGEEGAKYTERLFLAGIGLPFPY